MKIMIASDIHGSAHFFKKLLNQYDKIKPDKLVLLGDLLYHGPRNDLPEGYQPKEVIGMLNSMKNEILCVRGNCEAEVDQLVLDFPILADYMIMYLGQHMIFATHGHLYHDKKMPPLKKGDILLHGHTHIPALEWNENYYYLNPGSVSIPKSGSRNSYMVWEDNQFILYDLNGNKLDSILID